MAIESNVIFRIGSRLGPGGLSSLQSGITMVSQLGRRIAATIKEVERFGQVFANLEIDITQADRATKGLIDTMELMKSANKFTKAGMELTREEMTAVAKVATDFAQSTGIDATDAMRRLTESISKGSSRALKEVGIDLEETEDLLLAQAEAIEKVVAKSKGLNIEFETTSERLFALKNNLETAVGSLAMLIGKVPAVSEAFDFWNEQLAEFNQNIQDISIAQEKTRVIEEIRAMTREVSAALEQGNLELAVMLDKRRDEAMVRAGFLAGANPDWNPVMESRGKAGQAPTGKTGGGGGGGRRKPKEDLSFDRQEVLGEDFDFRFSEVPVLEISEMPTEVDLSAVEERREQSQEHWNMLTEQLEWWEEKQEISRENSLQFAEDWSSAWSTAFSGVSAGGMAAKATMDLLHAGVAASVTAAIQGQKSFGEAIRAAVETIATNVAIEAGFMGLLELARGIAATASFNYPAAALHFAAMGTYFATAVAAGAIAGVAHAAAPSSASSAAAAGGAPAGTQSYGGGYQSGGPDQFGGAGGPPEREVNINISMRDGADGFFDAIVDESDKASQDGRRSFGEAA